MNNNKEIHFPMMLRVKGTGNMITPTWFRKMSLGGVVEAYKKKANISSLIQDVNQVVIMFPWFTELAF